MNSNSSDKQEIVKKLMNEFGAKNPMVVPKIEKVVINCGLGEATTNKQILDDVAKQLAAVTGQKPTTTLAKHSISAFKVRRGQAVGLKVTLRGARAYNFLEKLFKIALPRLRDFRGLSTKNFDDAGNYTLGLKESTIFPEIATIPQDLARGLEITIVVNSQNLEKSKRLLELLGVPFAKN